MNGRSDGVYGVLKTLTPTLSQGEREKTVIALLRARGRNVLWPLPLGGGINVGKGDRSLSTEQTEAIVIRLADFSESSRVVTCFSREFGKLSAVAKGAKRAKSAFEAGLDLLSVYNIVFIRKSSGGLDILTEAQLKRRFQSNDRDLTGLYGGYYVAELLNGLNEEYDPHPQLYDDVVATLEAFSVAGNAATAILRFELGLLREIGQLPAWDICVRCGRQVEPAAWYGMKSSLGGVVCRSCLAQEEYFHRLTAGAVAVLRRLSEETTSPQSRVSVTRQQFTEIRHVLDAAIRQALGRRPKTLKFLKFT